MKFIKAIFVILVTKSGLLTAETIHPEASSLRGTTTSSSQKDWIPTDEAIGDDSRVLAPKLDNGENCVEDADCDSGRCSKILLPDGTEFGNLVCREKLSNEKACKDDNDCDSDRCSKILLPDGTEYGNLVCRGKLKNDKACKDNNDCRSGNCFELYDVTCFRDCLDGSGCSVVSLQPDNCNEERAVCHSSCSLQERECRQGYTENQETCEYAEECEREYGCNKGKCGKKEGANCREDSQCANNACTNWCVLGICEKNCKHKDD